MYERFTRIWHENDGGIGQRSAFQSHEFLDFIMFFADLDPNFDIQLVLFLLFLCNFHAYAMFPALCCFNFRHLTLVFANFSLNLGALFIVFSAFMYVFLHATLFLATFLAFWQFLTPILRILRCYYNISAFFILAL